MAVVAPVVAARAAPKGYGTVANASESTLRSSANAQARKQEVALHEAGAAASRQLCEAQLLAFRHFTPSPGSLAKLLYLHTYIKKAHTHIQMLILTKFAYLMWYCALQNSPELFSSSIRV